MKKIICFVLINVMVLSPVSVRASSAAASLEISEGLASGGLSGGADSITLAVALTLMVIYGTGMSVNLSEQAKAAGETAQQFIENCYAKWVGGTSAEQLTEDQREELKKRFKVISTGGADSGGSSNNKVDKTGKIYIASAALAIITKFLNWLKNSNLIKPAGVDPVPDGPIGFVNGTLYAAQLGELGWFSSSSTGNNQEYYCPFVKSLEPDRQYQIAFLKAQDGNGKWHIGMYTFRDSSNSVNYVQYAYSYHGEGNIYTENQNIQYNKVGNYYYTSLSEYFVTTTPIWDSMITIPWVSSMNNSVKTYLQSLDGSFNPTMQEPSTDESYVQGDYNADNMENANDGYTVIDPALYQQLLQNMEAGTKAQLSIADYVQAIMQQLNRLSNPEAVPATETVPVVNATDLSPQPQPLPDPAPDPVPATLPNDEPAPGDNDPPSDSDPVTNPDPAPPDVAVPHMMIPLDEYFPFCIPFDVYHLLQKLSADPVAPSYTIGFTVYGTEVNYTISLDAFSGAMVIVRRMELFVCVVGLAIASRKIFTR